MVIHFALQLLVDGLPLFPGGHDHLADALAQNAGCHALEGNGAVTLDQNERRLPVHLNLDLLTAGGGAGEIGEVLFRVLGADLHGIRVVREFGPGQWRMRPVRISLVA